MVQIGQYLLYVLRALIIWILATIIANIVRFVQFDHQIQLIWSAEDHGVIVTNVFQQITILIEAILNITGVYDTLLRVVIVDIT